MASFSWRQPGAVTWRQPVARSWSMPAVVRWLNPTTIPDPAPSGFLLVTEAGDRTSLHTWAATEYGLTIA